jgi:eukaryotic-like serine/threonine-protein kinase
VYSFAPHVPLQSGDRFGPYEIRALLGVGGMGEVYRGRDTRLGRDVALKVISPKLVGDESSRIRFQREARAASALNHPSIVTVYDVGEADGVSWIAMEWVDGRTLREALAPGPLPIAEVMSVAKQIAEGLAAAHEKGVVHRDLKPENVMIAADGRVRILDFGLARHRVPGEFDSALAAAETMAGLGATVDGVILGTVGYMSPEQAAGGAADFRSDQFAFGLLLYEMFAGRRAFARSSAVETLFATLREEPVPIESLRAEVPEAMRRVLRRCLSKSPDGRYPSTRELVASFDAKDVLIPDVSPTVSLSSPATGVTIPAMAARRRSRAFIATAIATALVMAIALFAWRKWSPSTASIDTFAVLPFVNRSPEADASYLADELTESLINQISRVSTIQVKARATVFALKDTADPLNAGRELNVRAVLTGSVLRTPTELSISAELVDVATGARLWGDSYKTRPTDLLRVQDSIVAEVSTRLQPRLSGEEKRALGGQGTDNVEAYELFLRARHLLLSDSEDGDLEARRFFLQATEKDPRFVDAYLGASSTYIRAASTGYAPPAEAWSKADDLLQKVRQLDPQNVGLRVHLATRAFLHEWDWATAEREYQQLAADPRVLFSNRYHPIAMFFWARGWPDQAVTVLERALRVDPGNLESRIMFGDMLAHAGQLDDAIAYYRAIIGVAPSDPRAAFGLAEMLKRKGDIRGAIEMMRKAYEQSDDEAARSAFASARTEKDYNAAQMVVARAQQAYYEGVAAERYVSPLDLARAHAQAADRDKAFRYLEMAIAERSPMLVLLKVDRAWDLIRDDARFAGFVRRLAIP